MKTFKKYLAVFLLVLVLFSGVIVTAQAAYVNFTDINYGTMYLTDAKISKVVTTTKVYGNYDYLNFYIKSYGHEAYFIYEIYSDKQLTKLVTSNSVYTNDNGAFSWSPMIKLKGVFKSGTYYGVIYAASIDEYGYITVSRKSVQEFKLIVDRTTDFSKQMVPLKSVTVTTNGPVIKWHKLSDRATKYVIYRRSMSGTKWTKVGTVNGSTLSFTDKTTKNKNGDYIYTVKAFDKKGTASRYLYNGPYCFFVVAPKISSVATTSDNRVQVKWNSVSGAAYYRVYRSENGGSWKLIHSCFHGTTFYDTDVENGKNYKYTVRTVYTIQHEEFLSAYYNVNKTVDFFAKPSLNPVEFVENGLKITWDKVEGVSSYTIYRKTLDKGAGWVNIGKTSSGTTEFIDKTAKEDSAFIYTVRSEGKLSRGSYSSKGVDYVKLSQPEWNVTINGEKITLNWKAIPGANKYIILEQKNDGSWVPYCYVSGTSYEFCPSTYFTKKLSVQAQRGNWKSDFNKDVEPIVFYPPTTLSITNYTEFINISWKNTGADSYKLYRKLKTEQDSEYKLLYSGAGKNFKDTTAEYDVMYTYMVKGVWNSQEQTNNFVPKDRIKYSPDKYISNFSVYISDSYILPYYPTTDYSEVSRYYYFNKELKPEANGFREKVYYKSTSGWRGISSSYEAEENFNVEPATNPPQFGFVVYDDNGTTPIDAFVSSPSLEVCDTPDFEVTGINNGARVTFKAVPGAIKYELEIDDIKKTVIDNGSKTYTIDITGITYPKYETLYLHPRLKAISVNGNVSSVRKEACLFIAPTLKKAIPLSSGGITLLWEHPIISGGNEYDYKFVVFRKAAGETSWTKIATVEPPNDPASGSNLTNVIEGVEYEVTPLYTDSKTKKGVKYTYTVRVYSKKTKQYVSPYNTKGISATAK